MNDLEQTLVFDTLKSIQQHAPLLCRLLNERATPAEADAYRDGVYSAVIRLSALFKPGEMEVHEERHRKIKADLDVYFAQRESAEMMDAIGGKDHSHPNNNKDEGHEGI
jgi:hypothetical protein